MCHYSFKASLWIGIFLICFASVSSAQQPELVEVLPLTADILMLHFDEGYVDHHDAGEVAEDDLVFIDALNVAEAISLTSYTLSSNSDIAYADLQNPTQISRKSKPTDFANYCQTWGPGCINDQAPDHTKDHWLYLHLPSPLQNGNEYTLSFPGLAGQSDFTWIHNDKRLRSEAIHVNIIGYVPGAPEKYGYVYHWMGDGGSLDIGTNSRDFYLLDTLTGNVAFTGEVVFRRDSSSQEIAYVTQAPPHGNLIGVNAWECNFSGFRQNGTYRLCVDGVGCSFPFDITNELYKQALDLVIEGLYQQRSGIETSAPFTTQPRPAPHRSGVTPGFAGRLKYSTLSAVDYDEFDAPVSQKDAIDASILGPLDAWGWYQDAGDWDSYFSHSEVPLSLLWLFEMHATKWGDGQLNLPEAGNGLPDLLDEAMWLPRFYQRLRAEMKAKNYGTGGLGGSRVFGDLWGTDVFADGRLRGSWQDNDRDWIVSGEDPFITYAYSGLAAHIAVLLDKFFLIDPEGIDWRQEALEAYAWAEANTRTADTDINGLSLEQVRLYATSNLFRLTGEPTYVSRFTQDFGSIVDESKSLYALFANATMRVASDERTVDATLLNQVKDRILEEGAFVLSGFRENRATRWGGNWFLPLIIGQGTTPLVQAGIIAHHFAETDYPDRKTEFEGALYSTADYFLGTNPLNQTWVTGLGERSPNQIFSLDSWVIGGETPRRGITPYGPWSKEFLGFFQFLGPYHPEWPFEYAYPEGEDAWPAHERWFDQRTAPLAAEYTIHQQCAPNILTYGYLYGLTAPDWQVVNTEQDYLELDNLLLVPNPAQMLVQLQGVSPLAVQHLELWSSDGRLVRKLVLNDGSFSVEGLPSGMYTAEISMVGGEKIAKRLLVISSR